MPLLYDWSLSLTVDQVLRTQGADPQAARDRLPRLVELAAQALALGMPLIQPAVAYRYLKVSAVKHNRLVLKPLEAPGMVLSLSGSAITRLLAPARQVVALVGSIGEALEQLVSGLLPANPSLGLALDAVGSAAVQALVEAACARLGQEAQERGWPATVPFSPGMEGWPAAPGQAQVFAMLDNPGPLSAQIGVSLNPAGVMEPLKSLSALIGIGPEVDSTGRVCDYCSVRQTCRHQDIEYSSRETD